MTVTRESIYKANRTNFIEIADRTLLGAGPMYFVNLRFYPFESGKDRYVIEAEYRGLDDMDWLAIRIGRGECLDDMICLFNKLDTVMVEACKALGTNFDR